MEEFEAFKSIGSLLSGVGATGLLAFILYRMESGKWLTRGNHDEVVEVHQQDAARAWAMVDKLNEALAANNAVLEKFSDTVDTQGRAMDALRATVEMLRSTI